MTPRNILKKADELGLDIIAITDHNSAENVLPTMRIESDILVLPGMEITTSEEAHVIAIFPETEALMQLQERVYSSLPKTSDQRLLYEQVIVNEFDEVEGFNEKVLISATDLDAEELIDLIHTLGGLAIASHVDREVFSILTQLGFIPESLDFDALELSFRTPMDRADMLYGEYRRYPWITSSDAHHLEDIARGRIELIIKKPSFEELRLALKGADGRGLVV